VIIASLARERNTGAVAERGGTPGRLDGDAGLKRKDVTATQCATHGAGTRGGRRCIRVSASLDFLEGLMVHYPPPLGVNLVTGAMAAG
jgi:hypothetical protein